MPLPETGTFFPNNETRLPQLCVGRTAEGEHRGVIEEATAANGSLRNAAGSTVGHPAGAPEGRRVKSDRLRRGRSPGPSQAAQQAAGEPGQRRPPDRGQGVRGGQVERVVVRGCAGSPDIDLVASQHEHDPPRVQRDAGPEATNDERGACLGRIEQWASGIAGEGQAQGAPPPVGVRPTVTAKRVADSSRRQQECRRGCRRPRATRANVVPPAELGVESRASVAVTPDANVHETVGDANRPTGQEAKLEAQCWRACGLSLKVVSQARSATSPLSAMSAMGSGTGAWGSSPQPQEPGGAGRERCCRCLACRLHQGGQSRRDRAKTAGYRPG